ncbi:MAG: hypothetical protein NC336_08830 [Clostridium sp.]|nr:hypothetical protein [Clostridium sp.]
MILLTSFFETTEFYVIAAVVAAAVVAACIKPSQKGAVATHLLAGFLREDPEPGEPRIEIECRDDRTVILRRRAVDMVGMDGAVSLAVSVSGFDISVAERLVPGNSGLDRRVMAEFCLDFLGQERYHLRYESDTTGYFTAFTLANRPGVRILRDLKQ